MANDEGDEWVGVSDGDCTSTYFRVDRRNLTAEQIAIFDDNYGEDGTQIMITWDAAGLVTSVQRR